MKMFIWPTLQSRRTLRTTTRTRAVSGPPSSWGSTCRPSTAWKPYVQNTTTTPFYFNLTLFVCYFTSLSPAFSVDWSRYQMICVYTMLDVHFWTLRSKLSLSCYDTRHPFIKLCTLHFSCRGNGVVYMSWDNTIFRCVLLGFIMW